MIKQIKVLMALQGIVVTNWVLSKLMDYVSKHPPLNIQVNSVIHNEPSCRLDDIKEATRDSLRNRGE